MKLNNYIVFLIALLRCSLINCFIAQKIKPTAGRYYLKSLSYLHMQKEEEYVNLEFGNKITYANEKIVQQGHHNHPTRRQTFQQSLSLFALSSVITSQVVDAANAATTDLSLLETQASKFKRVPVFAIVDGKTGTPFMILQNTGKAQVFFFTTYEGAQIVLNDARRDAADKGLETVETWDNAKLSAVNLEFALKVGKAKPKAMAQNNVKYDTVTDIIPSYKSLNEAEKIDTSGLYNDRGRVPLFYSYEFEIKPEKEGEPNRIPVFLDKEDLLREYTKKYPEKEEVNVAVVDLMDTFATMMGTKPIGAKVDDSVVDRFFIVPSSDSRKKAVELEKERGSTPAYKSGEMIAVGGK